MDNAKIFPQLMSKSRSFVSVSDSNYAKTKKKAVRNCDIINIKIKSLLYCGNTSKRKRDGAPISATLRLGIGQHSNMVYDEQISDIANK